ncbi:splicing factor 3B subunit 4-like [Onychomys torridus]|uniref:splicing factor 3B subunit 4-like n=1 Tax=Onychomys torridus TaxID=38674 RepID=UPI00167F500D|nr:splicing factor 3B subunit 4-like [Onychomys torridus]
MPPTEAEQSGYLGSISCLGRSGDSPPWKVSPGNGGGPHPAPATELKEALAPSKGAMYVVSGPPPPTLESMTLGPGTPRSPHDHPRPPEPGHPGRPGSPPPPPPARVSRPRAPAASARPTHRARARGPTKPERETDSGAGAVTTGGPPPSRTTQSDGRELRDGRGGGGAWAPEVPPAGPALSAPTGGHFRSWGVTELWVQTGGLPRRTPVCVKDTCGYP